jgi:hypothetical protein
MPHLVKRSRRPSIENRVRDILESPSFQVPADLELDDSLVSRLADFVGDYLMARDLREAVLIAEGFYRANPDIADLARAVLGKVLAEMST